MKIILSCTTTDKRKDIFHYGIQSLLNQSLKPDVFLINVSKEAFPENSSELPYWLQDDSITINRVKDVGPYTKLLPALKYAGKQDVIVTADDDILYDKYWLEKLINHSEENPDYIVCSRARSMEKNLLGRWKNYKCWSNIQKETKGHFILPLGVGGVVYDKKSLDLDFLLDTSFLNIAPTTDDLWYKMAGLLKNTPVAVYPYIDKNCYRIKHTFGLEEYNRKATAAYSTTFMKLIDKIRSKLMDSLGINRVANDVAWDEIIKYAEVEYDFSF